jgi:DNA-binding IclR family transcriptional regulator
MTKTRTNKRGRAASPNRTRGTESSRKVLSILSYFEPSRPLATVDTLARAARVPKSTAYRYISILRETGFITDDGRGGYHIAPRIFRLAGAARAALSFIDIAKPGMDKLAAATGETVILVRRVADSAVCIARAESEHPVRLSFEVGAAFPLHAGASSKVLLAHLSERERRTYLARAAGGDPGMEERLERLEQELGTIRTSGIGFSNAEITPDVWAVAAPVVHGQRVIASISVAGPTFRLRGSACASAEALTRSIAQEISAELDRLLPAS